MALTIEDVWALTAPFPYDDHEFTRGFAYLTEQAITKRLNRVDPSWEFVITDMVRDLTSATVVGRLTVCGISRVGVGTQTIEYVMEYDSATKQKTGNPATDGAGNPRESGEVRKGAATDALKRASRLFGIGVYILDAPKLNMASNGYNETRLDRTSEDKFKQYLSKLSADRLIANIAPTTTGAFAEQANAEQNPPPVRKGLTVEQATDLEMHASKKGVGRDELLLVVLKVERYGLYTGTIEQAYAALDAHLTKKANGGAK